MSTNMNKMSSIVRHVNHACGPSPAFNYIVHPGQLEAAEGWMQRAEVEILKLGRNCQIQVIEAGTPRDMLIEATSYLEVLMQVRDRLRDQLGAARCRVAPMLPFEE
jgi:hypothetical protein